MSRWTALSVSLAISLTTLSGCSTVGSLFKKDEAKTDAARGIPKKSEAAYFESAQTHLKKQRYDLAETDLMDLRTFYPVGTHSEQAQLDLIYIAYKQSDYEKSILAADRFIKLYPTHADVDYAYYVKGVSIMNSGFGGVMKYTQLDPAHRDTGYLRSAFEAFKQLVNRFPNSQYTPDAVARMHHMYNQFAESELNVARFNIRRGAYVGAAERARWVLQYFPQSPQVPEAIATLAHAYDKLGLTEQANKQKTLLAANYPNLLDGDKVRYKASRTRGSFLNRATLGLFGEPKRSIGYTYIGNDAPQGIVNVNAPRQPVTQLELPPQSSGIQQTSQDSITPSTNITIGLGLPPSDGVSNPADAVNDAELQQEKTQESVTQPE